MSDIILRIPENQLVHFNEDKRTTNLAFWRFSNRPRKLTPGDYIFFTRPEGILFAAKITRLMEGEELTDEIGAIHMLGDAGNFNACWNGRRTKRFDPPITKPNYAAQGFRYLTTNEQRKLRAAFNQCRHKRTARK